jgi:hypothetical protein
MPNDKLADISTFENIQSEAHQLMGFLSLSVFNAVFNVSDTICVVNEFIDGVF